MRRLLCGLDLIIVGITMTLSLWNITPAFVAGFFVCFLGVLIMTIGARDVEDEIAELKAQVKGLEERKWI